MTQDQCRNSQDGQHVWVQAGEGMKRTAPITFYEIASKHEVCKYCGSLRPRANAAIATAGEDLQRGDPVEIKRGWLAKKTEGANG